MVPRVTAVQVSGPHTLTLSFHDGARRRVNLLGLLKGTISEPLLDPVAGSVVWPNGADVAPETLYALPEEPEIGGIVGGKRPSSHTRRRTADSGRVAERSTRSRPLRRT